MKQITQTILHNPEQGEYGNCLSAVLASLLRLDINTVPVFINPNTWYRDLNCYLSAFNLAYIELENLDVILADWGISNCYYCLCGKTEKHADTEHASVGINGEMVFDPHPSRAGLKSISVSGIFISTKPWLTAHAKEKE